MYDNLTAGKLGELKGEVTLFFFMVEIELDQNIKLLHGVLGFWGFGVLGCQIRFILH